MPVDKIRSRPLTAALLSLVLTGGAFLASAGYPPPPVAAATLTPLRTSLAPTADASVRADLPAANYGSSTSLVADASPLRRSYLKFHAGAPAPTAASLSVTPTSSQSTGLVVTRAASTWTEAAITYGNAPRPSTVVCGRSGAVTAGTRVTITIDTAACPVRADGDTTFVLGTTSSTSVRLTSQESATPPTLRLTSAGTAATATATTLGTARLHAVNKAGTEYACAQGWGIFDGPHDQASVNVLKSWGINAVRVPLNEDCWLGINGVPSAYGGASYRTAIKGWTDLLRANSMRVILDLHWSAPGATLATGQAYMADADHSPAFWRSVAGTYKGDQGVLFDLFNEPHHVSWSVWRNGDATWAGMNQLIDAVRSTGATNWVIASGLAWGNDDSGWLANKPTDPAGKLAAGAHAYNFNACTTATCWDAQWAPITAAVPFVITEMGEDDCAHGFADRLFSWADAHGVDGYAPWTFTASFSCAGGPALVSDNAGTPTSYGRGVRDHYRATTP